MRILLFTAVYSVLLHSCLCEPADKGNILAIIQGPGSSRWMVFKTLSHELRKFGYKTTVVGPDDPEIEKQMTDSAIDFIVSEGLTQSHHIIRNSITSYIGQSFSGVHVAPSAQMFTKFCDYLLYDSALIETLRKRKFVAAVIDTPLLNLCSSVIPYRLSIPFIHFGRIFEHQKLRTWINPGVFVSNSFRTGVGLLLSFRNCQILRRRVRWLCIVQVYV